MECICGWYTLPVLERLLASLPVVVLGFLSDTCFKYVNHRLAPLMQELGLEEFATPLGRPSDNDALAGSRNGSVTRKRFGYGYLLGRYLKRLDQSYCDILPLLLNHQSSCHLLLWEGDDTGTQPAVNRQAEISTPYGWLSPSTDAEHFLSPSVNLLELY